MPKKILQCNAPLVACLEIRMSSTSTSRYLGGQFMRIPDEAQYLGTCCVVFYKKNKIRPTLRNSPAQFIPISGDNWPSSFSNFLPPAQWQGSTNQWLVHESLRWFARNFGRSVSRRCVSETCRTPAGRSRDHKPEAGTQHHSAPHCSHDHAVGCCGQDTASLDSLADRR